MDKVLDYANEQAAVVISDMGRCLPADALVEKPKQHHWHLIGYVAEGLTGTILGASSLAQAPEVTLPLGVSGWHAVLVGLWNPHYAYDGAFTVKLKLTGDPCFQAISEPEPPLEWPGKVEFKEVFFKYADLTGQDLVIAQQTKGRPRMGYVGYVKLVPLSPAEVEAIEKARAGSDTRVLYALNDGNGLFYLSPSTPQDLLEQVEPYRYSDVKAVLFAACSGDVVNYPSKFGLPWLAGTGDGVTSAGHRTLRDSLNTLLENNIVPLRVMGEHVRKMGVEFHAMFRMAIQGEMAPSDLWNADGLVRRRPDLRLVHMDGTPMEKASYAFPEVREFMLSLIREVIEDYEVDGVNLSFIRGPHYAGYEDIVVDDFQRQYGLDIRTLDENDIRAQQHRASYVTELVRQARQLTDEVGRKKGRKIELSGIGYTGDGDLNMFFGLDLMAWMTEGLVDTLFLSEPFPPSLLEACHANNCKLVMAIGPGPGLIRFAQRGLQMPVDGFHYDMTGRPECWEVVRQIGDSEQLDALAKAPPKMKTIPLKTVQGFDVCHTTNRGANERGYWPPEMLTCYCGG